MNFSSFRWPRTSPNFSQIFPYLLTRSFSKYEQSHFSLIEDETSQQQAVQPVIYYRQHLGLKCCTAGHIVLTLGVNSGRDFTYWLGRLDIKEFQSQFQCWWCTFQRYFYVPQNMFATGSRKSREWERSTLSSQETAKLEHSQGQKRVILHSSLSERLHFGLCNWPSYLCNLSCALSFDNRTAILAYIPCGESWFCQVYCQIIPP